MTEDEASVAAILDGPHHHHEQDKEKLIECKFNESSL